MNEEDKKEVFETLSALRDSGDVNMVGAPLMIKLTYCVSKAEAYAIFKEWAESLNDK